MKRIAIAMDSQSQAKSAYAEVMSLLYGYMWATAVRFS